jgi:hypothetical protein
MRLIHVNCVLVHSEWEWLTEVGLEVDGHGFMQSLKVNIYHRGH